MSDTNDATATDTTVDADGSEDTSTQTQKPSGDADPLALARKRQAGAEAARQKAEEARDAALAELEKYRASERTAAEKELADNAKLQERLEFERRRADEAEANANARILDALYPNARAKLPEITDEVRLAEFEAILAVDPAGEEKKSLPAPQNPNETNRTASGDATAKGKAEESSKDIEARLRRMPLPDWL